MQVIKLQEGKGMLHVFNSGLQNMKVPAECIIAYINLLQNEKIHTLYSKNSKALNLVAKTDTVYETF